MTTKSSPRQVVRLREGWRFAKCDPAEAEKPDFDDSGWQSVVVPHDWAIEGPFHREHDLQVTTIVEDGEKRASQHVGRTGGLPHAGIGWYRTTIDLAETEREKRVFVEFDGAMSHAQVFLNGSKIGYWPYGYSSFGFELTEHIRFGQPNTLAVRCDVKPSASRWYPGAGIYRNVRLVVVEPIHVACWGAWIVCESLSERSAEVRVRLEVENQAGGEAEVELETHLIAPDGGEAGRSSVSARIGSAHCFVQRIAVRDPMRWDLDAPRLYRAQFVLRSGGKVVDEFETAFGIREARFDANEGFLLNGRKRKMNGVCMHHDLGALGAAVNRRALERQLEILRDMGCNAIRTSHNPPAPELLDLCDRMGFLVIDEAFDEWRVGKCPNGYHNWFDEWAEKDLRAMIRRDRNHPCVIMWSIGNEIGEQSRADGARTARFLHDICHDEDPTRPTTAGFNNSDKAIENGLADVVDVPGWNYKPHFYQRYHREHPDWPMVGSETESCVSSRGEYYFPVEQERGRVRETLHVTSYDVAAPPWGYPPDPEFAAQEDCPFLMGEFVWTGFDYLGEPTPFKTEWPSRSSYFGIVDLCGIPKDRYYLYRARWSSNGGAAMPLSPTLHLLPHWTWPGREGEITPVHCYTSYPSAELFLNGRSLGRRCKNAESETERFRLIWNDVRYEPGTLKVVAYDGRGNAAETREVRTASLAWRIELKPDREEIAGDGEDLCFVAVRILDKTGELCPRADDRIFFEVEGPAEIAAVDNGDQTSMEPFRSNCRKAFNGQCMAIVRSRKGSTGAIRVVARGNGLQNGEARFTVR